MTIAHNVQTKEDELWNRLRKAEGQLYELEVLLGHVYLAMLALREKAEFPDGNVGKEIDDQMVFPMMDHLCIEIKEILGKMKTIREEM